MLLFVFLVQHSFNDKLNGPTRLIADCRFYKPEALHPAGQGVGFASVFVLLSKTGASVKPLLRTLPSRQLMPAESLLPSTDSCHAAGMYDYIPKPVEMKNALR